MSNRPSCIIHEFPIPEREYYVAAPAQWDRPASPPRRSAPSRLKRRKRGRSPLLPLALAGLSLFLLGFLLGRVGAVGDEPSPPADPAGQQFFLLPGETENEEEKPIQVQTVPGAVISSGNGGILKDDWKLVLVNWEHPLPENFQVPKLTQLKNGHAVDSRAYPELQRMMDDCRAAGLEPLICSSYRSWEKQAELFEKKVISCLDSSGSRKQAEEQAAEWVSRPGTSEHQAGLALDIVDKTYQLLDEKQEDTPVQKWLMEHCAEYGYILRYPTDKSYLTGVNYEPWHYRYVGAEAAREIMSQGLCLEEYLENG